MRPTLLVVVARVTIKATLHATGLGGLWSVFEEAPELFKEIWLEWTRAVPSEEGRRLDLEATTQADDATGREALRDPSVAEALNQFPAAKRGEVEADALAVLRQIGANARHTFQRPGDPAGLTVPRALAPREARDLVPILLARKPLFKKGDRPTSGKDWELIGLLGIGGFGEVWKARHLDLTSEPPRALKFCTDPDAKKRLRDVEAAICDRVQRQGRHAGIVRLIDANLRTDPPCLHFEYIAGGDLAGLFRQWKSLPEYPSPILVSRVIQQVARPLAHVHRLKPDPVVHRDVKPTNILVDIVPGGKLRFVLTDFGIGGVVKDPAAKSSRAGNLRSLADLHALSGSGTPLYASPEQLKGEPARPTDDVHALGVLWYQLLVGDLTKERPGGVGWKKTLAAKGLPDPLISLLESCFEDADDRPRDAQAFLETLEAHLPSRRTSPTPGVESSRWVDGEEETQTPDPTPWRVAAVAFLLVLVLAAAWMFPFQGGGKTEMTPPSVTPASIAPAPPVVTPGTAPPPKAPTGWPGTGSETPVPEAKPPGSRSETPATQPVVTPGTAPPKAPATQPNTPPPEPEPTRPRTEVAVSTRPGSIPPPVAKTPAPVVTSDSSSYTNSLGMTMIRIEPGEFLMGSSKEQIDTLARLFPSWDRSFWDDEQPRHKVRITRPFHMAARPVTVGQFRRFVEATGYVTEAENRPLASGWTYPGFKQQDDHPVVEVSYNDARAFLAWLNERADEVGRVYRLPTEAEWEYACRAGTQGLWGVSDDPDTLALAANTDGDADGFKETSPVGSFPPSAWGLHDMLGNVWQWCDDWYDATFYGTSPTDDPRNTTVTTSRVARGGSWGMLPWRCRPAFRMKLSRGHRDEFLGFRPVATDKSAIADHD